MMRRAIGFFVTLALTLLVAPRAADTQPLGKCRASVCSQSGLRPRRQIGANRIRFCRRSASGLRRRPDHGPGGPLGRGTHRAAPSACGRPGPCRGGCYCGGRDAGNPGGHGRDDDDSHRRPERDLSHGSQCGGQPGAAWRERHWRDPYRFRRSWRNSWSCSKRRSRASRAWACSEIPRILGPCWRGKRYRTRHERWA